MARRPTFDELRDEAKRFIGPPEPPQIPKTTRIKDREAVRKAYLKSLANQILLGSGCIDFSCAA